MHTVLIGHFGGSITAANGWRPKTLAWFKEQFPKAAVEEINAAIGGTGSDLGVFRYRQDCLRHKPDSVFVEFSVNDGGAPPEQIYRAMEGIVRQTWRADPTTDLCFVYTFANGCEGPLRQGLCPRAATADEHFAEHYGIPSINPALRVVELEREGKLVFRAEKDAKPAETAGRIVFSHDGVHPLDAGHDIYLHVVREAIAAMQPNAAPRPHAIEEPMRADNWEAAKLVPIEQSMLGGSWQKLDPQKGPGRSFGNRLPTIWEGTTPGDKLTFRFRGRMVGLYDLVGPDGGRLTWTIDGTKAWLGSIHDDRRAGAVACSSAPVPGAAVEGVAFGAAAFLRNTATYTGVSSSPGRRGRRGGLPLTPLARRGNLRHPKTAVSLPADRRRCGDPFPF